MGEDEIQYFGDWIWEMEVGTEQIPNSNFELRSPSSQLRAASDLRPQHPQRLNVGQWSPSVFVAELFSFSAGLSSDLADVAFWSLFCP